MSEVMFPELDVEQPIEPDAPEDKRTLALILLLILACLIGLFILLPMVGVFAVPVVRRKRKRA